MQVESARIQDNAALTNVNAGDNKTVQQKVYDELFGQKGDGTKRNETSGAASVMETGLDALKHIKQMESSNHKINPDALGFGTCTIEKDTGAKVCRLNDGDIIVKPMQRPSKGDDSRNEQTSQHNPFGKPSKGDAAGDCDLPSKPHELKSPNKPDHQAKIKEYLKQNN
ncbi:MAG: hypothetical protein IPP97_02420 [Candidatus Obscuribacter sp.]|nr:hypothetical protein [Candidatus Obscuribacter sp.]MBP6348343.1 hypothetical protein [Candidatus Obscuribacter sp.]MBP6591816.1 hypothetical protein [Candidatus Obscuribacter sp.]MBP7578300.1 hypothetical protein [Candidatus Obscuribacter sp.]